MERYEEYEEIVHTCIATAPLMSVSPAKRMIGREPATSFTTSNCAPGQ